MPTRPRPTHVVLAEQGQGPGRGDLGVGERLAHELVPLEHPHAEQPVDLRPETEPLGRQDHRHALAVPGGELLGDPVGELIVAPDEQMSLGRARTRNGWHGVILAIRQACGEAAQDRNVRPMRRRGIRLGGSGEYAQLLSGLGHGKARV